MLKHITLQHLLFMTKIMTKKTKTKQKKNKKKQKKKTKTKTVNLRLVATVLFPD